VQRLRSMAGLLSIVASLALMAHSQNFTTFERVEDVSDKDFLVQRSQDGPYSRTEWVNGHPRTKQSVSYLTSVSGKGTLSEVRSLPNGSTLIKIQGINQHHEWIAVLNPTNTFTEGAAHWQQGDSISLSAQRIVWDDPTLPKVFEGNGTTNLSRTSDGQLRAQK
jgi:hypothetical protein